MLKSLILVCLLTACASKEHTSSSSKNLMAGLVISQVYTGQGLGHNWGGVDYINYRNIDGSYSGRTRDIAPDEPENSRVITVTPDKTVAWIQSQLALYPNEHVTISFEKGTFHFTQSLRVHRGDITIKGKGPTLSKIMIDFAGDQAIELRPKSAAWSPRFDWIQAFELGDYTTKSRPFNQGSKTLELVDSSQIAVGNILVVADGPNKRSLVEVESIDGNVLRLRHSLGFSSPVALVRKTDLLKNVSLRDLSFAHAFTNEMIDPRLFGPVHIKNIFKFSGFNYTPRYAVKDTKGAGGELPSGMQKAVVVSGTYNANLENLTFHQIGSHALFLADDLELFGNNLVFDVALNRGSGGNGYGIELAESSYCDLQNIVTKDMRHGVSYNLTRTSSYNNIHVLDTDSNVDFHGGFDQGNIYYIENSVADPFYLPLYDASLPQPWQPKIDYRYQFQWPLIEYRRDENELDNTVIFNAAIGMGVMNNPDNEGFNKYHSYFNDILHASPEGSVIYGGIGSDILIGDIGVDKFYFANDYGKDEVKNFDPEKDLILIKEGTVGITTPSEAFAHAVNAGENVKMFLGEAEITFKNLQVNDLSVLNFEVVSGF